MPSGMTTVNEMTDMDLPKRAMKDMAVPNEAMTDMAVQNEVMTDMAVPEELIGTGGVVVLTCALLARGTKRITVQTTIAVHVTLATTVAMEHRTTGAEALSMVVMTEAEALAMVVTTEEEALALVVTR
jgi:hypothetical protein